MNNCCERISRLVLLAAVIVGIVIYAVFTAADIAAFTLLFPLLIAVGILGLLGVLIASAHSYDDGCFCSTGLLAALGGAGTVLFAFIAALVGSDGGTALRVLTAIGFAFLTLLLGGIVGLLADHMDCIECRSSCPCESDQVTAAAEEYPQARYYRR